MNSITFFAQGKPCTAGSKTAIRRGNRIIMVNDADMGKRKNVSATWRNIVAVASRLAYSGEPIGRCPIELEMCFLLVRPQRHFRKSRGVDILREDAPKHHLQKPDAMKMGRAVEDALTGIMWIDDCCNVSVTARKGWVLNEDEQGVVVTITLKD